MGTEFLAQDAANHVWTIVAAALVFLMQAGFLMLEAGSSRTSSAINVAMKNLIDFIIAAMVFYTIGFALMFGESIGPFGTTLFAFEQADAWVYTFFVFQLVFAGTAATIVSGAIAERTRIAAYFLITLICGIIYPVVGHWAWGNLLIPDNPAWLADLGFLDFAGSTVVHSTGAWIALAAAIVVGPRIGKFGPNGERRIFPANNASLSVLGAILLWIGWIGFNGGSTTAADPAAFAPIIANTIMAGAAGGAVLMIIGAAVDQGLLRPERSVNGVLGGLVAITAGCNLVDLHGAIAIGAGGGLVVYLSTELLEKMRVDDVVGAVPVHGFAGAFGTVALAFFSPVDSLPAGSIWGQFMVQAMGVGVVFGFVFGTSLALLYAVHRLVQRERNGTVYGWMRVSVETEEAGLNEEQRCHARHRCGPEGTRPDARDRRFPFRNLGAAGRRERGDRGHGQCPAPSHVEGHRLDLAGRSPPGRTHRNGRRGRPASCRGSSWSRRPDWQCARQHVRRGDSRFGHVRRTTPCWVGEHGRGRSGPVTCRATPLGQRQRRLDQRLRRQHPLERGRG